MQYDVSELICGGAKEIILLIIFMM